MAKFRSRGRRRPNKTRGRRGNGARSRNKKLNNYSASRGGIRL